jgi:NADPH-dependent ferric siderophore reductase
VEPGGTQLLLDGLSQLAQHDAADPASAPGYAYVLTESRAAVVLREALSGFGLSRADVYAKGYWNLNARSGR